MPWIEYHTALRDHWKIQRLADIIGSDYISALGAISCLWLWVTEYSPNGDISRFQDNEIRNAARCKSEKFCKSSLLSCELIDDKEFIKDWKKHGLKLLVSKRKSMKKYRERLRHRDTTVVHNHTIPNRTVPNHINTIQPEKSPAGFSEDFVKKADEAKKRHFNIYQLMNRFYKESKLAEKLPEGVFSAVLDEFNLRGGAVRDHWPYFIKVLENKSAVYFASKNIKESEEFKKKPALSIGEIMARIK